MILRTRGEVFFILLGIRRGVVWLLVPDVSRPLLHRHECLKSALLQQFDVHSCLLEFLIFINMNVGAWGGVVVKALRY